MARALTLWALLAAVAACAVLAALTIGTYPIATADLPRLLFAPDASTAAEVLHVLRMPRVLAAFATGGLLALAGALMQVLLRNPLADPYVMGVSGGAAAGALAPLALGFGGALMHLGAAAGAALTIVLVFALAQRDLSHATAADAEGAPRLLLTGVMLAAAWAALVTLLLTLAPEAQLRGMLFWLAGDLGNVESAAWPLAGLAALLLATLPLARDLNPLLRGPLVAQALGVAVPRLRRTILLLASLATALAVVSAGSIGFVGLVVPHALRLLVGNDQRVLLPASALAGGTLLVAADTAARTLVAPAQLPVGVVTALIGVPTFLWLLLRNGGRR
jgi:iron complex transport system permease protein